VITINGNETIAEPETPESVKDILKKLSSGH